MKFKTGDRAKQTGNGISSGENPLVTVTKVDGNQVYHIHDGKTEEYNCDVNDLTLVGSSKVRLQIQENLLIVLKDYCNNRLGSVRNSYKEALDSFTPDKEQSYTIYKLVEIAKVELSKKVTKIRKSKITKRKK